MPVRPRRTGWVYTTAISWRLVAQRFSFVLFLILALGLLVFGRTKPVMIESVRAHILDSLAPVLDALARPMVLVESAKHNVVSYLNLRGENEKLRAQIAQLTQWQNAALALDNQNRELRGLLHYKAEPQLSYISARVIADAGGPFVRSLIITAGKIDGVREGMAAMTGDGLIGRVVEVGDWSSRILLITDMNSRIPVTISGSSAKFYISGVNGPVILAVTN